MNLHHIAGNTYYISFPSIVGVYIFADQSCLLIDSGASDAFGSKTIKLLNNQGLKVHGILNTHFHGDHTGGNALIQEETNCLVYASMLDKAIIEHPIYSPFSVYSAYPLEALKNKLVMARACNVTHEVNPPNVTINNEDFKIIDLGGHTMGQIGIVTPDEVFFTGDAIISERNLAKFPFLYMADLESHLQTIERLKKTNYPYVVASHDGVLSEWRKALMANEKQIEIIKDVIMEGLNKPRTKEAIVQIVVDELDLSINTSQYYLISASISAYISYLHKHKLIRHTIIEKQVKFHLA